MQVLRFIREYGNTLKDDLEKLRQRWTQFLFFAQLNPDQVPLQNELLRLVRWSIFPSFEVGLSWYLSFRSVNLIHPSLPPPSGVARLTWCLTEPGPYRYRNIPSANNTTTFDCLVIWLKEIDEVRRYRVSISDNATVEWIEGKDVSYCCFLSENAILTIVSWCSPQTESLKRLVHKHLLKVPTYEQSHILPPEVDQAKMESKNCISRTWPCCSHSMPIVWLPKDLLLIPIENPNPSPNVVCVEEGLTHATRRCLPNHLHLCWSIHHLYGSILYYYMEHCSKLLKEKMCWCSEVVWL